MNLEGESHQGQTQVKILEGKEKRQVKRVRRLKSSKGKCFGWNLKKRRTVKESLDLSREEAGEISFVPSAISIPQRRMFLCDNRCSDKALSFWQTASVVAEDGEESYTANLCQQCNKVGGEGRCTFEELAVVRSCGGEGASWKVTENAEEGPVHTRNVGGIFL